MRKLFYFFFFTQRFHLFLFIPLLLGACETDSLAQDRYSRQTQVDIKHYRFQLHLKDQVNRMEGKALIRFLCREPMSSLTLDFVASDGQKGMNVQSVQWHEETLAFEHLEEKLSIRFPKTISSNQLDSLEISYYGIPKDGLIISRNKFGDRTFFGDNWPNRAHHWLPCIDHPYEKASVEFIIQAPDHYKVVANGKLMQEKNLDNGMRLSHWYESLPLPTKVMVFGAARFAIEDLGAVAGVPLQSWVFPQNRETGFYDYGQAKEILPYYVEKFGPFPYLKLANVQSKTRYGGMENASNIFYSENSVRGDRSSEGLLAHEIVHQWFGDSASELDWYHIWLSEGFATYFTHTYMDHRYGRERMVSRLKKDINAIKRTFKYKPGRTLVDPKIQDLNQLLDPISYEMGGWVLHMLRKECGEEAFWKGIRTYYERFKFSNALSSDFQAVMEKSSGLDLAWFFDQWLNRSGIPRVEASWSYDASSKQLQVLIKQDVKTPYILPLELAVRDAQAQLHPLQSIRLSKQKERFVLDCPVSPVDMVLDPHTWLLIEAQVKKAP